ncbi:homodimeric glycerol 3-phosphate dehydrogenase (quinone) [Pelagirhabdus alkalitolerans]|uniref:Aerobic glycerol-3-phosphate dehydrogenase n=1 Tax=Pelagirhabdus alkalitolerans TaxID=1612202 RepID=A0A1G6MW35_9BACI|nr:FAD-dependent oxidoreductase [Pelagirhabdus alkalitolerans]SDC59206.1 homodimeric glycerol 3-phosphate dehydrogenase (quinone) [Pelagirhabdus alkalitolerans]
MALSNQNRQEACFQLMNQTFDVLVIGGGLTGASICLDASTRGMNVALIEQHDFAIEASGQFNTLLLNQSYSKSKFWKQAYKEQSIIKRQYSPLTQTVDMVNVEYDRDIEPNKMVKIKEQMIDPLKSSRYEKHEKPLTKKSSHKREPFLSLNRVKHLSLHQDSWIDQSLMTLNTLKKAGQFNADVMNYLKAVQFIYHDKKVIGVEVEDQITGELFHIKAHYVINATGSSSESVRKLDRYDQEPVRPLPMRKMIQLVVRKESIPINQPITIHYPLTQQRVTLIPYGQYVWIKTSERTYQSHPLENELSDEEFYRLAHVLARAFVKHTLEKENFIDIHTANIIDYNLIENQTDQWYQSNSGLISTFGVPLPFYRLHAGEVVDMLTKRYKKEKGILYSTSDYRTLTIMEQTKLHLNDIQSLLMADDELTEFMFQDLSKRYGDQLFKLISYYKKAALYMEKYPMEDQWLAAEVLYAIEREAVYKPLDFLARRKRYPLYAHRSIENDLDQILAVMRDKLAWTKEECSYYNRECRLWMDAHQVTDA